MTLRTRLTLSHLFVIALFATIFISVVMVVNGGMGPSRGAVHSRDSIFRLGTQANTLEELKAGIVKANPPTELQVGLRYPDGHLVPISGTVRSGRTQSFLESIPLNGGELQGTTLEVRAFRPKPPPGPGSFWNPLRDLVIASSLAGLACFAIAVALSNFISEPVARLATAVENFEGSTPEGKLTTTGPPEIKELAETFNEMALRLSTSMQELREKKEEAERSEASRREFLGEVSHNLRTPLAAILGWTETLIDDLDTGNERAYLKRIRRETRYVATTIERLLDLSRWERARPMLHLESFPLTDILMETAENLEEAASEKRIELELDLPESDCWVEADRHRVRDLFQILLENVIGHAGEDVSVKVSVRRFQDRYQVSVCDDGVGLPDSLRSDWKGEPVFSDTGRASLGLAIAYHLARAHKGELTLEPGDDGVGTRATFSLPFSPVSGRMAAPPVPTPSESDIPHPAR